MGPAPYLSAGKVFRLERKRLAKGEKERCEVLRHAVRVLYKWLRVPKNMDGADFIAFSASSSEAASSEHDVVDAGEPAAVERRYVHIRLCVPACPLATSKTRRLTMLIVLAARGI